MDALAWYFSFGVGTTLIALAVLVRSGRAPNGWKGIAAMIIGALFWPLALLSLWYERQKAIWTAQELPPKVWLKEPERSGKYHLHPRVQVIIKHAPRRMRQWNGLTFLIRPRPTIDAPVLLSPHRLILTFLFCQVTILKPEPTLPTQPPTQVKTPTQGFTLIEVLIVIAIIGILAAVLYTNYRNIIATGHRKAMQNYLQSCVITAEHKRSLLTNAVTLPDSCLALGLPHPAYLTSDTIALSGNQYTITLHAPIGGTDETFTDEVRAVITPQ